MYSVFQSGNIKTCRKVGVTRFFTKSGDSIPVTVVEIESNRKVGTTGSALTGKHELAESISNVISKSNKSDRKRDRKNRWR